MICIYKINNKTTGKIYIGSAIDFTKRKKQHIYHLNKGTHHSKHLQSAWNKYGEADFDFEVIVKCVTEYLIKLEQWFIDNLKPEYNMTLMAGKSTNLGRKFTAEHIEKISASHRGKVLSEDHKQTLSDAHNIPVIQYDKEGNFIKEWNSMKSAKEFYNNANISLVCLGHRKTAAGFIWKKK